MEAAYKTATRNAQQLTKDITEEEIAQMLGTMATIKDEISKVPALCFPPWIATLDHNHIISHYTSMSGSDKRENSAPAEGLSGHAASIRGDGETYHWVLPIAGEGEPHHFLPGLWGSRRLQTEVSGD